MFRWFVGLGIDDLVWVPTVFTKNRDRLLTTEMSRKVMVAILTHREVVPLLSDEHFSVDGTLVKAWASKKSFQPKAEAAPWTRLAQSRIRYQRPWNQRRRMKSADNFFDKHH